MKIVFIKHPNFQKEAAKFDKRSRSFLDALESFERICVVHFDPMLPAKPINPGKLHLLSSHSYWQLWKIEIAVKGLKQNQSPRVWFAMQKNTIVYLSLGTHCDNYDDGNKQSEAARRALDILS